MKNSNIVMVVPCFNEALRFNQSYFLRLTKLNKTRWIFVDDGSTDNTSELLNLLNSRTEIDIIRLNQNLGKAEAIRKGFLFAQELFPNAEWYGYLDSDGAFDFYDVKKIMDLACETVKPLDAYFSSRIRLNGREVERSAKRHLIGRMIITIFTMYWKRIPYDTQSGYKLFKANNYFFNSIITEFKTKWFVDIELTIRISKNKKNMLEIWEEPLTKWKDINGSKISLKKALNIFLEIVYVQYLLFINRSIMK